MASRVRRLLSERALRERRSPPTSTLALRALHEAVGEIGAAQDINPYELGIELLYLAFREAVALFAEDGFSGR
jgi:hypothetical protein